MCFFWDDKEYLGKVFFVDVEWWMVKANSLTKGIRALYARATRGEDYSLQSTKTPLCARCSHPLYIGHIYVIRYTMYI